jgi:hypothetical protein
VRDVAGRLGWKANPLVSAWLTHVRGLREPADFGTLAYLAASTLGMKTNPTTTTPAQAKKPNFPTLTLHE